MDKSIEGKVIDFSKPGLRERWLAAVEKICRGFREAREELEEGRGRVRIPSQYSV